MLRYFRHAGLAHLAQDLQVFLAGPRVPQTLAEHRFHVKVGHYQAVLERGPTGDHRAVRGAYDAGSVEDQFILPAHRVEVRHKYAVVGGARGDHPLPLAGLAGVERRCVDVDDYLGAGLALHRNWPYRVPDVLANAHTYRRSVDDVNRAFFPSSEIPVFVEHPVVGQVHLAVPVQDAPVVDDGRRVR